MKFGSWSPWKRPRYQTFSRNTVSEWTVAVITPPCCNHFPCRDSDRGDLTAWIPHELPKQHLQMVPVVPEKSPFRLHRNDWPWWLVLFSVLDCSVKSCAECLGHRSIVQKTEVSCGLLRTQQRDTGPICFILFNRIQDFKSMYSEVLFWLYENWI